MLWEYLMSESENNPVWVGSRVNRELEQSYYQRRQKEQTRA